MNMKYILCIPNSCGFNDVMCQIYEAYVFSIKTNRKLIIDTRLSGLADHLSNYMELINSSDNIVLDLNEITIKKLNKLSCSPKEFTGKINTIYTVSKSVQKNTAFLNKYSYKNVNKKARYFSLKYLYNRFINGIKNRTIAKDFKYLNQNSNLNILEDKKEDVIIFHSGGGGELSIEALKLFKINVNIIVIIKNNLKRLGFDYDAVHIRNTDYTTNYIDFLKAIQNKLIGRTVLICTDDFYVVESAKKILKDSKIISLSKFYNLNKNNSYPMHHQWDLSESKIFENNINILCDLIGISKSTNFYYTQLNNDKVFISGFSKLGENLKNNSKIVDDWLKNKNI